MHPPTIAKLLVASSLVAAAGGCAAQYDDYPCGRVPYGYCPPPPLPYTQYDACPTPFASRFRSRDGTDSEVAGEISGPIDLATAAAE